MIEPTGKDSIGNQRFGHRRVLGFQALDIRIGGKERRQAVADSRSIRTSALAAKITIYTTGEGARAACMGLRHLDQLKVYALQELHAELN